MHASHTIRLHGPWECTPLEQYDDSLAGRPLPPPGRLAMPGDVSPLCGAEFRGRVRLTRRFHWPAILGVAETLWLVLEEIRGRAEIFLGDHPLGAVADSCGLVQFEITRLIQPELMLVVCLDSLALREPPGILGGVRLEVRIHASGAASEV